jgi:hypothetical protein
MGPRTRALQIDEGGVPGVGVGQLGGVDGGPAVDATL